MQRQLELFREEVGLWKRPKNPERLFFAARPDSETVCRVDQLRTQFVRNQRLKGTPLRLDRLHLSICAVGDYARLRSKYVFKARQAARMIALPPFVVTFFAMMSFENEYSAYGGPNRHPLILVGKSESETLFELSRLLHSGLGRVDPQIMENFVPHMTLLYGPAVVPIQAINPIRLVVDQFVLIHSERGLTRHHTIDRWQLKR